MGKRVMVVVSPFTAGIGKIGLFANSADPNLDPEVAVAEILKRATLPTELVASIMELRYTGGERAGERAFWLANPSEKPDEADADVFFDVWWIDQGKKMMFNKMLDLRG